MVYGMYATVSLGEQGLTTSTKICLLKVLSIHKDFQSTLISQFSLNLFSIFSIIWLLLTSPASRFLIVSASEGFPPIPANLALLYVKRGFS